MTSYAEKDDDYVYVVERHEKARLIACADSIQWIVQALRGKQWQSLYFCRSKVGLRRHWNAAIGDEYPDFFPEADYQPTATQLREREKRRVAAQRSGITADSDPAPTTD